MIVYFYGIYDNKGGMENYARTLINSIMRQDSSIHFVLIKDCPHIAYEEDFLQLGCSIIQIPAKKHQPFAYYHSLLALFKKASIESSILQLNIMSYRNGFLFKAVKKSKAKTIVVAHGSGIQGTRLKWLHTINRQRFRRIGTKVAISKDAAVFAFGEEALIIKNAIDPTKYAFSQKSRDEIRHALSISDEEVLLGHVGRIHPLKNQLFSIKVLELLLDINPVYKLCLIGKDQDTSVRHYIQTHHLESSILLLGEKNPAPFYSAFDLLLLPSIKEGAGLVLYEGHSNGLPCIASTGVPKDDRLSNVSYLPLEEKLWVNAIGNTLHPRFAPQNNLTHLLDDFTNAYISLYKSLN